jgi:hypothetical protein
MAVEPDEQQLAALSARAGADSDGPVVMLNLHRYRDRDAYMRYGEVATAVLERVGGRRYPSLAAFAELAFDPAIADALADRAAGLERARLICCAPGAYSGMLSSELQR